VFEVTVTFTHAGKEWAAPIAADKHPSEWTVPDIHEIVVRSFHHVGVELGDELSGLARLSEEPAIAVYAADFGVTIGPLPISAATLAEYLDSLDSKVPSETAQGEVGKEDGSGVRRTPHFANFKKTVARCALIFIGSLPAIPS
jgi:hypothetical protein